MIHSLWPFRSIRYHWNRLFKEYHSLKDPLPKSIERCFELKSETTWNLSILWFNCFKAIRVSIAQSLFISVFIAFCAMGSASAAMKILKPNQDWKILSLLAFSYFLASILGQVGTYFNNQFRNQANHTIQAFLVSLVARKLLRLSSRVAARQSKGNLKILITSDTLHVAEFFDSVIRNFVPALVSLLLVLPWLVLLTGTAGLVAVFIMMSFVPISFGLNLVSTHFHRKGQTALDSLASLLGEWVKNIRLVRGLSWNEAFQKDVRVRLSGFMKLSSLQHLMGCLIFGFSVTWWMVAVTGVFITSQHSGMSFNLANFFGSLWLITFLAGYFIHLPNTVRLLALAAPSMHRISKLMSEEEQNDLLEKDLITQGISLTDSIYPKTVVFRNVSFEYEEGKPIIRDISISIPIARKTVIVGEVASGKTTFLKLVCGEFPPTQGEIQIEFSDGSFRNLWQESTYFEFRKHIAWVPQEPFVSCDPLSSNISLSTNEEETAVLEAAYWAELEADLSTFTGGIREEIGEGGINLSGGQKQRLNIARAYYSRRSFLVLDDSLSAVDGHTEATLMKRLREAEAGFLLATHRTAEVREVESALVMKEGRIIEQGTPHSLASNPQTHFSRILRAYQDEVNRE